MRFDIAFHGPFAVATGQAGRGADSTVNAAQLLPGRSLKGVMRAAAEQIVGPGRHDLVERVFGTARHPSPWHWSSASFVDPQIRRRARTAIEESTRTVADHTLRFAEEVWAHDATFTIEALAPADDPVLHTLLLKASAQAVQSLGMDRRRGLGWVTIRPDPPLTGGDLDTLIRMVMP